MTKFNSTVLARNNTRYKDIPYVKNEDVVLEAHHNFKDNNFSLYIYDNKMILIGELIFERKDLEYLIEDMKYAAS